MAQVGVQQPTNLMEMFSSPSPMLWGIASQQVNDQTLGNAINRAQAQQSMDITNQKLPFELARMGLENQGLEADIPGRRATSSKLEDEATLSRGTLDAQMKARLSDLATTVSKNDLLQAENAVKSQLLSNDPKVRQAANILWEQLSEIKKIKLEEESKTRRELSVAGVNNAAAKDRLEREIEAGKYKKAPSRLAMTIETLAEREPSPSRKQAYYIDLATDAQQRGDEDAYEKWTQKAARLNNAVVLEQRANPKAGGLDLGQTGGVAVNETPSAMPDEDSPAPPKKPSMAFSSEGAAEAALKAGKIKPGDIVIINGRKAKVQ